MCVDFTVSLEGEERNTWLDVAHMDEVRNVHLVLAGKSERKCPLKKKPSRWKSNYKVNRTARLEIKNWWLVSKYRILVRPYVSPS